jgi:3-isopropylmalate/(R)-2-methylmalate dehydratase large subunit
VRDRRYAPDGKRWDVAGCAWSELASDVDAHFDESITIAAAELAPTVTWGTSPQHAIAVDGTIPDPGQAADPASAQSMQRALD